MARKRSMKRNQSGITFVLTPKLGLKLGKPVKFDDAGTAAEALELWAEKAEARGVDFEPDRDVELDIWEGDDEGSMQLAEAMIKDGILRPSTIDGWYDHVEDAREDEQAAMFYAVTDLGGYSSIWEVWKKADTELRPMEGTVREYAEQLVDDIGFEGLNNPEYYFDYEAYGRDARSDWENIAYEPVSEAESELEDAKRDLESAQTALEEAQSGGDQDDIETAEADVEYAEGEVEEKQSEYDDREAEYERVSNMSDREIGEEVIEQLGWEGIDRSSYIDYDALARDMEMGGDVTTFEFAGKDWVIQA